MPGFSVDTWDWLRPSCLYSKHFTHRTIYLDTAPIMWFFVVLRLNSELSMHVLSKLSANAQPNVCLCVHVCICMKLLELACFVSSIKHGLVSLLHPSNVFVCMCCVCVRCVFVCVTTASPLSSPENQALFLAPRYYFACSLRDLLPTLHPTSVYPDSSLKLVFDSFQWFWG